jgi:glucose/arabinose dehydrogenase
MAFAPNYRQNRRFYVYYTDHEGDIRVVEFRGRGNRARKGSARTVLVQDHSEHSNHNGGQLQFGPDGFLYIGLGDGGGGGDPFEAGQDLGTHLGKILRIDPRGRPFKVPRSNPFRGRRGAKPAVYSYGLRNPWRFSFDRATGDLTIADVGQNEWEEIDHVGAAKLNGANFGWDLFEGDHVFEGNGSTPANYEPPVLEFSHDGGNCSVTGGYVVHDNSVPALDGRYVYADFCAGDLRSLAPSNPTGSDSSAGLDVDQPSSFGLDSRGHLYVASLAGPVYRIAQN